MLIVMSGGQVEQESSDVTFYGVRGSTPCNGRETARYGGNTSCVSLSIPGHDPILFDMGTGMRYFGLRQPCTPFCGHVLLSHLHWDHTQGLPFFTPILREGSQLDIYAPAQSDTRTVGEVLAETIRPPLFPIPLAEFPGQMRFHDVDDSDFELGGVSVMSRLIPHCGPTCGYRVSWNDRSVTYISDHQMPCDGSMGATDAALELVQDTDLLIHDSQFTTEEFAMKSTWGHCTAEYAVWLAAEAGAKKLALFHHDPGRCDDAVDRLYDDARRLGDRRGVEVVAASEGLTLRV